MLRSGEEYLGIITSEKEWAEMMDARLLIPATNTTTTCSSSSSGITNPSTNNNSMAVRVANKPSQAQTQALRCPRCDSSNTKFCYYNNYSLSQPRHFCKACKRYWTRGGMLRNVPVGGGCRKNKRARKPSAVPAPRAEPPPPDPIASSACLDPAAIYALQTAVSPLPILPCAFDPPPPPPPPHLGGLGLDLQALPPPRLLDEFPLFVSNLSPSSLLLCGLEQPKQLDYQTMLQIDELQASEINGSIKLEAQSNNMNMNTIDWLTVPQDNSLENLGPAPTLYWNTGIGGGGWPDGVNCGSSVSSLI